MITRRAALAAGALTLSCLLTACGTNGVVDDGTSGAITTDVKRGIPDGLTVDPSNPSTAAAWLDRGESFAIVTWGSSSCAPIATDLTTRNENTVAITFEPSPEDLCTADLAPTTHEFDLPDEVTLTPVTVEVSIVGEAQPASLTLE